MRRISIVLALASLVAILTTTGSVHVGPHPAALAAGALLLAAALAAPERWRARAAIASALVAGLVGAHVLLRAGMPQVHDFDHVWGLWAYARAVRSGHPLPAWMPWLGAGMPLLPFYGPVSFLTALPGVLLGLTPVGIWKLTFAQASVLAAASAMTGARLLGASWRGAAIAACALALSPWTLTLSHYRGALGETVALAWAPVAAAAAMAMVREPTRARGAWLAGSVALLAATHLITAFCLALVLVPALALDHVALRGERLVRRLGLGAAAALLGAGTVALGWVPAAVESGATSLSLQTRESPYFVYAQHGLTIRDLAVRREWDRPRASLLRRDREAGRNGEQMPFYVGAVALALGLTAPWWSRSRRTWAPACGAAVAIVFSLAPAADLMTHLPLVDRIQFPWRFLTSGAILGALAAGAGVSELFREPLRSWRAVVPLIACPALLVVDAAPYTGAAGWIPPYRGVTHWALSPGADPAAPFDVSYHAVPQRLDGGPGMVRVGDLLLPPDTTDTPVELGWLAYVEWTTPAYYRGLLATRAPEEFGEAGMRWFFLPDRDAPLWIPAKPYATLVASGVEADAGTYARAPGRIALRPRAPDGGAKLVLREQAFPGWRALVDGEQAAIVPGTLGFMTIDLPAGEHDVVLEYTRRTPARFAGLAISLLSIAIGVRHLFLRKGLSPFSRQRGIRGASEEKGV